MADRNKPEEEEREPKRKVLDLSAVQVVASSLATVVGAVLASLLGVNGTIIGVAVVSASATTGAAVFQHAFRRTGEGIRSRVPVAMAVAPRTTREERARQRADARAAFALPADGPAGDAAAHLAPGGPDDDHAGTDGESVATSPGRTARTPKGWKTYALTTGLVFALAMATVTAVELIAGKPVAAVVKNEPGKGTSLGGGSAGTPGPSTSPTPTPDASSRDATPQTGSSAAPDVSGAPGSSVSSTPSSKPTPTATTHGSSAPVLSTPSVGGAVGSAGATAR